MKREPRHIVIERGGGSSLIWFVLGGALGAGLGLLFAPQSGDRTRRQLGRKLGKLRDAADLALEDLREALEGEDEEGVHRSLAEPGEDTSSDDDADGDDDSPSEQPEPPKTRESPKRRTASAREELERRLAEVRARRQRALADEDEEPVA